VTRTPLSRSKVQRSPGRFTHRALNASGSCSGQRGNALGVRNYCYVVVCLAALGASCPQREERGGAYRGGRPPTACFTLWSELNSKDIARRFSFCHWMDSDNSVTEKCAFMPFTIINFFYISAEGVSRHLLQFVRDCRGISVIPVPCSSLADSYSDYVFSYSLIHTQFCISPVHCALSFSACILDWVTGRTAGLWKSSTSDPYRFFFGRPGLAWNNLWKNSRLNKNWYYHR